jgi:peptidyl-prolyl cis-trans isomerase B (cyclophilin B)
MKFGISLASLLFPLLLLHGATSAQQTPTATPSPNASPTPAGADASAPSKSTAVRKANQRPVDVTPRAPEPFDRASVEEMAAQCVTFETDTGTFALEMLPEAAPETVRSFLNLAATGSFDTTTFSRVVTDFVVQGGNLSTSQKITPELARRSRRTIPDEPSYLKHVRGIASMARPTEPNSATTNFFILVTEAPFLDGKFSAFARVTSGMAIVDKINREPVEREKPIHPIRIKRATVAPCAPKEKDSKK